MNSKPTAVGAPSGKPCQVCKQPADQEVEVNSILLYGASKSYKVWLCFSHRKAAESLADTIKKRSDWRKNARK